MSLAQKVMYVSDICSSKDEACPVARWNAYKAQRVTSVAKKEEDGVDRSESSICISQSEASIA